MNDLYNDLIARQSQLNALLTKGAYNSPSVRACRNFVTVKDAGKLAYTDTNAVVSDTNEKEFSATAIVTTLARDREGDVVIPAGIRTENYIRNPIVLWNHSAADMPVGKCESPTGQLMFQASEDRAIAKCYFTSSTKLAEQVGALVMERVIRATSIGFQPHKAERIAHSPMTKARPHNAAVPPGAPPVVGWRFDEVDLLEWSWTAIGMNAEAVATRLGKGMIGGSAIDPFLRKSLEPFAAQTKEMVVSGWDAKAVRKGMTTPITKSKDAAGHEHGADGKFVGSGNVSVRQAQDAAMKLGPDRTEEICGPGGLSGATASALKKLVREASSANVTGEPLKEQLSAHLEKSGGKVKISTLREEMGHEKFNSYDPLSNPVHAALKELVASGHVRVNASQWGEPSFEHVNAYKAKSAVPSVTKAVPQKPQRPGKPKPNTAGKVGGKPVPASTPQESIQPDKQQSSQKPQQSSTKPIANQDPMLRDQPNLDTRQDDDSQEPVAAPGDDEVATDVQAVFVPHSDAFSDEQKAAVWVNRHNLIADNPQWYDEDGDRPAGWLFEQFPHEELSDDRWEVLDDGVMGIVGTRQDQEESGDEATGATDKGHMNIAVRKDTEDNMNPMKKPPQKPGAQPMQDDMGDEQDLDQMGDQMGQDADNNAMQDDPNAMQDDAGDEMGGDAGQPMMKPSASLAQAVKELIEAGLPMQEEPGVINLCHGFLRHLHKFMKEKHPQHDLGFEGQHQWHGEGDPFEMGGTDAAGGVANGDDEEMNDEEGEGIEGEEDADDSASDASTEAGDETAEEGTEDAGETDDEEAGEVGDEEEASDDDDEVPDDDEPEEEASDDDDDAPPAKKPSAKPSAKPPFGKKPSAKKPPFKKPAKSFDEAIIKAWSADEIKAMRDAADAFDSLASHEDMNEEQRQNCASRAGAIRKMLECCEPMTNAVEGSSLPGKEDKDCSNDEMMEKMTQKAVSDMARKLYGITGDPTLKAMMV